MLQEHPKGESIHLFQGDFTDIDSIPEIIRFAPYDLVAAASSLQWAKDLDQVLKQLTPLGKTFALALFTSGTFRSLHEYLGITSPILSRAHILDAISQNLNATTEIYTDQLSFDSPRAMFDYIRHSGVSGNRRSLDYRQVRALLSSCPVRTLEFEIIFASGVPKTR